MIGASYLINRYYEQDLVLRLVAILPGIPQPSAFEQSQNMTEATDIDLSDVPPSVFGAVGIAIGGIIAAIGVMSLY